MSKTSDGCWKVRPTPRSAISLAVLPCAEAPKMRISPPSTGYNPVIAFTKVVLPAPLGPMRAWISPGIILADTFLNAINPPNFLTTFLTSTIGRESPGEQILRSKRGRPISMPQAELPNLHVQHSIFYGPTLLNPPA